jgi:hypothetical protein
VWATWWQERQDEVMDDFLVEPQNQGRARTTWEPSHEWRLAEATPSLRGFQWFTRKPLGSLADPQSQDRRTEDGGAAARDRCDRWMTTQSGDFEVEDMCRDRKACIGLSKFVVAGHPSNRAMIKISEFTLEGHVSLIS